MRACHLLCFLFIYIFIFKKLIINAFAFSCTEKGRLEAQVRAAEAASRMKAETESKLQREKEREAARVALQKVVLSFIAFIFLFS